VKIAICTNHFDPLVGGSEYVTNVLAQFLSQEHEVCVLTRPALGRERSKYLPIRIVEYQTRYAADFMKKMTMIAPDVIFIYSDLFDFFKELVLYENPFKSKIIVALCGANLLHLQPSLSMTFFRRLDRISAIVCHSKWGRDYKLCSHKEANPKTYVVPNGVHLSDFSNLIKKNHLAEIYNLPMDMQWSVNVSNFYPGKGQEHCFRIAKHFPQLTHIQIAHSIPYSIGDVLETSWQKKSKGSNSSLLKNIPRQHVLSFLRASNLMMFTSEKEEAPLVLLEAMACELPWVSADVGNTRGLKGGICVNAPKDAKHNSVFSETVISSFVDAVKEVLVKPTLGREGREQIEKQFQWNHILPQYKFIIENV